MIAGLAAAKELIRARLEGLKGAQRKFGAGSIDGKILGHQIREASEILSMIERRERAEQIAARIGPT